MTSTDGLAGRTRWCYIDDCRKPATLIIESYPDDVTLCEDHAFIHRECLESNNGF